MKMNAGIRAAQRVRSSVATIATPSNFRETYTTGCFIPLAAVSKTTVSLELRALRALRLPGKWREEALEILSGTKLRASFGEGIKEPAVFDQLDSLYGQLALLPNGSQLIAQYHVAPIGPENSRTYDGGVDQLLFDGRSRVSLTLFHNEFTNGIEYIPQQGLDELGIPSADCNNRRMAQRITLKLIGPRESKQKSNIRRPRDIFVRAGYTYIDAQIQHSFSSDAIGPSFNPNFPTVPIGVYSPLIGARPFRIAPHTGYFEAGYRHSRLFASLRGTLVGKPR